MSLLSFKFHLIQILKRKTLSTNKQKQYVSKPLTYDPVADDLPMSTITDIQSLLHNNVILTLPEVYVSHIHTYVRGHLKNWETEFLEWKSKNLTFLIAKKNL